MNVLARAATFETTRKDQSCHFRTNLLLALWNSGRSLVVTRAGKTSSSTRTGIQRKAKNRTECRTGARKPSSRSPPGVANYWLTIPSKQYDDLVKKFAKAKGRLDGT